MSVIVRSEDVFYNAYEVLVGKVYNYFLDNRKLFRGILIATLCSNLQ